MCPLRPTVKRTGNLLASRTASPHLHSVFISGHFYFSSVLLRVARYQIPANPPPKSSVIWGEEVFQEQLQF